MIYWWLMILLANWFPDIPVNRVARINRLKRLAEETYQHQDYKTALIHYRYLRYHYGSTEEEISINLAHCYFLNGDTAYARKLYEELRRSRKRSIRSVAFHQLGILANHHGSPELAVRYFRNALRANPDDEAARYNYELLRKRWGTAPPPDSIRSIPLPPEVAIPPPQPQHQPKQETDSTQNQVNNTAQSPPSEEIGQEQAEMILDAIQNQEQQYQQQTRRRASKPTPSSYKGPDW